MLRISRINRIGMIVPELEPQVEQLEGLFGFRAGEPFVDAAGDAQRVHLTVPGRSDVDWEVLTPKGAYSRWRRAVEEPVGPLGIFHIDLGVPDLEAALSELQEAGIEPWREPEGRERVKYSIHPRHSHGILFFLSGPEEEAPRLPPPEERADTLGIVAINHLSHAYREAGPLMDWYEHVLGMKTVYRSREDGDRVFATGVLETPTRQLRWEVIQPVGDSSFVQRFLDRRGPGIHHVTFEVGDWDRALAACAAHGVTVFGEQDGVTEGARWREAFIHPRQTGGMLVQFFWEERPGVWI